MGEDVTAHNLRSRAYYATHRDMVLLRVKRYDREHADKKAKYGREYRARNRAGIAARDLRYNVEHKAAKAAKQREYRVQNHDAILEWHRGHYLKNRERVTERCRLYRLAHPEEGRAAWHRHRAKKLGNGGSHTAAEWRELCEQWGNRCLCCGATKDLTCDHVVPVKYGGRDSKDNLQLLCKSCNSRKGAKTIDYRPREAT